MDFGERDAVRGMREGIWGKGCGEGMREGILGKGMQ